MNHEPDRFPRLRPGGLAFGGYTLCLRELTAEEGGGWLATIPQLGVGTFHGDGESPMEALLSLAGLWEELKQQPDLWGEIEELVPWTTEERAFRLLELVEWWRLGGGLPRLQRVALGRERETPGSGLRFLYGHASPLDRPG